MRSKLNYCFQLTANQSIDNYWIRANPPFGNVGFEGGINSAILRYDTALEVEPATIMPPVSVSPLRETDLHPLESMPVVSFRITFHIPPALNPSYYVTWKSRRGRG